MYDWPELRGPIDAMWISIRKHLKESGIEAPSGLSRDLSQNEAWYSDQLLLSQTCGYPFAVNLTGNVRLVGAPTYDVEGCGSSTYRSAILMRSDSSVDQLQDTNGLRFAFNGADSLSGYRCLTPLIGSPSEWFDTLLESGAHRNSAGMVANGEADVAVLDAVCWHYFQTFELDAANRLKLVGWTQEMPSLPFITRLSARDDEIVVLRHALNAACQNKHAAAVRLSKIDTVSAESYNWLSDL